MFTAEERQALIGEATADLAMLCLLGAARRAFALLPRPARYGNLAFLEANLRGDGGPLPINARRQQGLLALFKTECTQGGCGRCATSRCPRPVGR